MYAIVETGGKQYKVSVGQVIAVEKLAAEKGDTVELSRVLMVSDGENVRVGSPLVEGAKVSAKVLDTEQDTKVTIFKFKPKKHYRRKLGHRQWLTHLQIEDIAA